MPQELQRFFVLVGQDLERHFAFHGGQYNDDWLVNGDKPQSGPYYGILSEAKDTAIFVTWDDWGGFYDHAPPTQVDRFGFGIRVPLLVISPYAKKGYVSKALHSHVSVVRFCEQNFGLPSLNARTVAADAMEDCFDLTQQPLPPPA